MIAQNECYEYTVGKWEGDVNTFKTCAHCLALRDYVKAHVPCFCWYYENMLEDAIEAAREWSHEAPGLLFGAYRRKIQIRREQLLTQKPITNGLKPVFSKSR